MRIVMVISEIDDEGERLYQRYLWLDESGALTQPAVDAGELVLGSCGHDACHDDILPVKLDHPTDGLF